MSLRVKSRLLLTMILNALALSLLALRGGDSVQFAHLYVLNQSAKYRYSMTFQGHSLLDDEVETTVKAIGPPATIHYKVVKLNVDLPGQGALPEMDSKVGPLGMPDDAHIHSNEEFFILLAMGGIAPNQKVSAGDEVTAKWTNGSGDATLDCHGKIDSLDKKTMTVDWTIGLTSPDTPSSTFKLKSVYSTSDFSLIKSDGTIDFLTQGVKSSGEVKVERLPF